MRGSAVHCAPRGRGSEMRHSLGGRTRRRRANPECDRATVRTPREITRAFGQSRDRRDCAFVVHPTHEDLRLAGRVRGKVGDARSVRRPRRGRTVDQLTITRPVGVNQPDRAFPRIFELVDPAALVNDAAAIGGDPRLGDLLPTPDSPTTRAAGFGARQSGPLRSGRRSRRSR